MSINDRRWLGLPLSLLWGCIAATVSITGDGFELASLSHYIKAPGFPPAEASFTFTLYGLAAALSAWISGMMAETITPLKAMTIDFVLWCVFRVLFLVFGLGHASYALILIFYGIRGFAYPLFLYLFIMAIVHNVKSGNVSSVIGQLWAVYSIGIGVFGSYIPSFTILYVGELGTLQLTLVFCATGDVITLASLRHIQTPQRMQNLATRRKFFELGRAATLPYTNRNILLPSMIGTINTFSPFGFMIIIPVVFVGKLGFIASEWFQIQAVLFFIAIFSNVLWRILGEELGRMKVAHWSDCVGMAFSSLAFYYIPQHSGHSFAVALIPTTAFEIFVAAFVPLAAVFSALELKHRGAAISVYNLSAGMSNFLALAITVVLLPFFSAIGVVIVYTALYTVAFFLYAFTRVEQPGPSHKEATACKQVEFSQVVRLTWASCQP